MRMLVLVLGLVIVAGGYLAYFMVSTAKHDPAIWHVDPLVSPGSETPNDFRIAPTEGANVRVDAPAPVYSASADVMADAWDDFALAQRDTIRIAGLPGDLWMTYVQRTPTLKLPDYISIRFIDLEENRSTIAVHSRSRYGYGDLGVNKARLESWIASMASFEADPS